MISLMRFILALSALIIIYIDPSEPNRFVAVTYAALIVYTALQRYPPHPVSPPLQRTSSQNSPLDRYWLLLDFSRVEQRHQQHLLFLLLFCDVKVLATPVMS
jgi:hypothetical protein